MNLYPRASRRGVALTVRTAVIAAAIFILVSILLAAAQNVVSTTEEESSGKISSIINGLDVHLTVPSLSVARTAAVHGQGGAASPGAGLLDAAVLEGVP